MRKPSPHSQKLLSDVLLFSGFMPQDLVDFLVGQGQPNLALSLDITGPPLDAMPAAIRTLADAGKLNKELVDSLQQQHELVGKIAEFNEIRIEMEFAPSPDSLISNDELEQVKLAAQHGQLHDGLGFAQLNNALDLKLRKRAGQTTDKRDQMFAWFDAANRQVVGPGDDVLMVDLLEAAIEKAVEPGKKELAKCLKQIQLTSVRCDPRELPPEDRAEFEATVDEKGFVVDSGTFQEGLERSMARICLVRVAGADKGTGFLVGNDLILTNYHVLDGVISEGGNASSVRFLFDYRTVNGQPKEDGPQATLDTAGASEQDPKPWLIDTLEWTEKEKDGFPVDIDEETPDKYLDFALVRIKQSMGIEPGPEVDVRGYFVMAPAGPPYVFASGTPILIIGHPQSPDENTKCAPQVFSMEKDSVIAVNPNRTRVRYRTNTLKGSSGSPVLGADFQLVALHHMGKWHQWNQGIPISAIADRPLVKAAIGGQ